MKFAVSNRGKLSRRINSMVASETPLRDLARNLSRIARYALNEANSLSLERVAIKLERLPKKLDGFRIIHLSDIHHSPFTNLEHITRTVKIANRLKPDMFVLTGDYVSHETEFIAPVAEVLSKLEAEFGTHACLGNHDHWTDAAELIKCFRREKINLLINEGFRLTARDSSFWLAGVDDYMVGKTDVPASLRGSFPDEMKILLAHNPVIIRQAARFGIDLMFSGHTHGGQVKVRESKNKLFARRKLTSGLHRRKNTQIYITRGIGTVVLPVRYQCPPEISLIELKCA